MGTNSKWKKREKLIVIALSGKEYEVGFLSPCKDGVVIGATQIGDKSPPHLTVLKMDGKVSSHITYQDHSAKPHWFPPMTINDLSAKFQELVDRGIIFQLTAEEQSQKVIFLTQKLANWFNAFMAALYQKKVSKKQVIHILNIKNVVEMLPAFILDLKEHPDDYFGFCQAKDLLENNSRVLGISESGLLIFPIENELISIRLSDLLGANFVGLPMPYQGPNALEDVYESLGLPQYLQQEIFEKRYLENLFATEKMDQNTLDKFKSLSQS